MLEMSFLERRISRDELLKLTVNGVIQVELLEIFLFIQGATNYVNYCEYILREYNFLTESAFTLKNTYFLRAP